MSGTGIKTETTSDRFFKKTGSPSSSGDCESGRSQITDEGEEPYVSFEINNSSFVDEEESEDDSVEEDSH